MSLLLDTKIFIAIAEETVTKLQANLQKTLSSNESFAISVVSIWEIAIKARLGILKIAFDPKHSETIISRLGIAVVPVSIAHVVTDVTPWPATNDPFDRLLLAQCLVEGLKLLTVDRALAAHPLSAITDH
jgi:PIN domain nuclease of toxin-antitoxin system